MFTRLLLVLFSCLVFQQKSLADESYGYLRNISFSKIPCTTGPFVNATGILSTQLNGMINCSTAIPPAVEHMKRQTLKCERFLDVKDDPLPCAKRNYKVLAINLTEQSRSQMATHEWLARNASNISKECLNNVSDMICKVVAPACDRNETMVVELLSRQDCERIISCLNTTSKVKKLHEGMMNMCRSLQDTNTATKIPLSLVYTEFDDNITPKTHNDTKITTTPTTQSPIPNKIDQSRNGTGESDSHNTPTRPFLNSTDQNRKPATMPKSSPTTQANITKPNAKSKPATKKPTVNATYQEKEKKEAKSVPNLTPTTETLLNLNYTTQDQHGTELSKTPQLNATSSPVVSRGNATTDSYVYNATTTNDPTNHGNKAAQFNTRMNALAVLVISFLSICMWQ
ncbi:---NA--- [Paramuricea clavata]|uniref:---NA n=1 Tax=Paramuricea clavata TaxID=317549 RepID=A0A7D9J494_PARCT|nr:---NA--- [Paramuricea clavata]